MAVGYSGTIVTSQDGENWTELYSGTAEDLIGIHWDGKQFIAIGTNGTILTLDDTQTDQGDPEEPDPSHPENPAHSVTLGIKLQVDPNSRASFEIGLTDVRTTALGIDEIDLSTGQRAEAALIEIDKAIRTVSSERGKFGTFQNRLEYTLNSSSNYELNLTMAESRIADADIANQVMGLTKNQILSQSSQAILSQANQLPQQIIQLLN